MAVNDVAGKVIRSWDSREHAFRTVYDTLRRPLRSFGVGVDPDNPEHELLTERLVYGEQHPEAERHNMRGKLYLHLDQAGVATTDEYDFKGNPRFASRRLTNGTQYRKAVDWTAVDADQVALPTDAKKQLDPAALESILAPRLENDPYTSSTTYDALNRPVTLTTPDKSVIRPSYNEANLLDKIKANLHGGAATHFITNIDYNAKGQRVLIDYGNGAWTEYSYDRETFRLTNLETYRGKRATSPVDCTPTPESRTCIDPPDTCPQLNQNRCVLQKLHYTYDPTGNITHIRDAAQQIIYFRNKIVDPSAGYTYDAIYRLIEATGREHLGQVGGTPIPHSYNDAPRVGIHWSENDGNAMGTYTESCLYDAVGNFVEMNHRKHDVARSGWKRAYTYVERSLIETEKYSNRLSSTTIGNGNPITEQYGYDAHGNMQRMPHLQIMQWDYKDQLQMTQRQKVNDHQGERTYYVYDSAGQRVRKVTELTDGNLKKERIYLGGFEIYREHSGIHPGLKRETLHIMDDKQRIALVETRNNVDDGSPKELKRYQFGNHLGSATLELDDQAQIISYEEYTPYGSTSYQAVHSQTVTPKRYRYTGKERDEESGLYYHGARYYASWLGRWTSCDPAGLLDTTNLYLYAQANPMALLDPTGYESVKARDREAIQREISTGIDAQLEHYAEQHPPAICGYPEGTLTRHMDPVPNCIDTPNSQIKLEPAPLIVFLEPTVIEGHMPAPPAPSPPPKPKPNPAPKKKGPTKLTFDDDTIEAHVPKKEDPVIDLHQVEQKIRQLQPILEKSVQDAKSESMSAVPVVGWIASGIYDLSRGDTKGAIKSAAEEGATHFGEKVIGNAVPIVGNIYTAGKLGSAMEEAGKNVRRMEALKEERYHLKDRLGHPDAKYDLPDGRHYLGPGGLMYDKRTGKPVERIQGR